MKRAVVHIFAVLLCARPEGLAAESSCLNWFKKAKIKTGKDCLLECSSASLDFSSLGCDLQCTELCKSSVSEKVLFKLSDLYPGLTDEERALAAAEPINSFKAYQLSWRAEKLCVTLYPSSRTNDESDACRHFIWAALLRRELESKFSSQVLSAHEQDSKQPEIEKAMDLANNRQGLLEAERLIKTGKASDESFIDAFKENLKRGRLIVIKKGVVRSGELK